MDENTALVPSTTSSSLAKPSGEGFSDLGPIKPSNIVLVQNTSREGTPGKFRDTTSGEEFDELTIAVLARKKSRVLFPEGELGAEPICKSFDGVYPVSEEILGHPPMHDNCSTCPQGTWENYDRKTKTGKPPCKEQARLMLVDKNTGLPSRLTLNGMSLSPLRKFLDAIMRDAYMAGTRGETRNIYDYFVTIRPEKIVGRKGSFYVVSFSPPQVLKPEDRGKFGPLYQEFVKNVEKFKEAMEQVDAIEEELAGDGV